MAARFVVWRGLEGWRAEAATVELEPDGLVADGVQIGVEPRPYRVTYQLDAAGPGFVTRSLRVEATGDGWSRSLRLERNDGGEWHPEAAGQGDVDLPAPGGDPCPFAPALDCDLAFCPLTNTMPIRRHRLDRQVGTETFVMAWVSIPDLAVTPSRQHYTHLRRGPGGAAVRYESESRDFVADLEVDRDGLVITYPGLATRAQRARW